MYHIVKTRKGFLHGVKIKGHSYSTKCIKNDLVLKSWYTIAFESKLNISKVPECYITNFLKV